MSDKRATVPNMGAAPRAVEQQARKMRKRRDASAILTVLGVVLFTSPLISAIGSAQGSGGVPVAVQYVFDIWAVLIAAAFIMSRLLPGVESAPRTNGAGDGSDTISQDNE